MQAAPFGGQTCKQTRIKCWNSGTTFRAEQGPCEPNINKDFVSKSGEREPERVRESHRDSILTIALQICLPSPCSAHKALAQLGTPFLRSLTLISPVLHYAALTQDQLLDKKNCRMILHFIALGHNSLGRRTCVFGSMVTSQRIMQEYIPLEYCARVHYCNPGRPMAIG